MRPALFALLLVGCTNPDDIITVRGNVLPPADGQVVRLVRQFAEYGTQGQCRVTGSTSFKETQTDSEGNYVFELFRIEAESFGGQGSYCFRVDTTFASGNRAWTDFAYARIGVSLSPLRDWRPSLRMEGDLLRFEAPVPLPPEMWVPGEPYTSLDHRAEFATSDGGIIWRANDLRTSWSVNEPVTYRREAIVLDSSRVEDFSGVVHLEASLFEPRESAYGVTVNGGMVELRPVDRLPLTGARVPVSRGLACPEIGFPCPLTDGDLTSVDAGNVEELVMELPAASALSTLVLRGVEGPSNFVDVSVFQDDGGVAAEVRGLLLPDAFEDPSGISYPPVRLNDGGYGYARRSYLSIPIDAGVPVRSVKLHFENGLWRAQEISLFD